MKRIATTGGQQVQEGGGVEDRERAGGWVRRSRLDVLDDVFFRVLRPSVLVVGVWRFSFIGRPAGKEGGKDKGESVGSRGKNKE